MPDWSCFLVCIFSFYWFVIYQTSILEKWRGSIFGCLYFNWLYLSLVTDYLTQLINSIKNQTKHRSECKLSWLGIIAAVKLNILPVLLFIFQNIFAILLQSLLNKIQTIIINLIGRGGGRARIKTSVLQQLIKQGALALPDVKLYYSTAMLMALIQGWNMETKNIWYAEQHRDHIPLSKLMLFEPEFFERY